MTFIMGDHDLLSDLKLLVVSGILLCELFIVPPLLKASLDFVSNILADRKQCFY